VIPGRNGVFQPLLVADGRAVGVWRRNGRSARPSIGLSFFESPSERLVRRFTRPLAAWARFQGVELDGIAVAGP